MIFMKKSFTFDIRIVLMRKIHLGHAAILTVAHRRIDTQNLYEMQETFASGKEQ